MTFCYRLINNSFELKYRCGVQCLFRITCLSYSEKDDGRCKASAKGVYSSKTSCKGFHVCYTAGRLIRTGSCPCDRYYDPDSRSCQQHNKGYFRSPKYCDRYSQCRIGMGGVVVRQTFRCKAGFAFDTRPDKLICVDENEVPGCRKAP